MPAKIEKCSSDENKHEGDATSVVYSNGHVFSSGAEGRLKIWDTDLNLKKNLQIHEAYIYSLAITSKGKLYSSSCDGTIRTMPNPLESDECKELVRCEDEIECLLCDDQDNLYSGDDKGVVTQWNDDRLGLKFNLLEHVKSMAVQNNLIYTIRDLDCVVTHVMAGTSGKYSTKATLPGKSPLALVGPKVNGFNKYLVFATRDGKGLTLCKNLPDEKYATIWTKENSHEMIINCIRGTDDFLFTGAYDGKLKKWKNIDKSPELVAEVDIGSCVNAIALASNDSVYVASSDGGIRRVDFA